MCYNIAVPATWETMFSGETLQSIYSRSNYDGTPGGSGWSLDQIVLTEKFNKYSGAKCILNDRITGYNRLCRSMNIQNMSIGSLLNDIKNGQYSDYHCLRPYEEYKDINQFIVNAISSKRWDFIDKVVYINLDERTDRKRLMEDNTLNVFDRSKVQRFSAVKHERGNVGCTRSHIEVLKLAIHEGWKNVLILEDDAQWNKYEEGYAKLYELIEKPYDVIMLSPSAAQWDPNTMRLIESETSCGYIVSSSYFVTLLKHYEEGLELLETTGNNNLYVMDEHWKSIQKRDIWYTIIPAMIYQRPGYSDIFYREVDYRYRACL
jgi:glycosyl transferase family 25